MKLESLRDVLTECVRDLHSAESQLVKALPRMARAAASPLLRAAFTEHLEQTRKQIQRLDRVCVLLGIRSKGNTCLAMKGLIAEGQDVIDAEGEPAAKDAALIGAAQKVEHYEIAGYGTARRFADVLDEDDVADLLQVTLDEEMAADERLTDIADDGLNDLAAGEGEGDEAPPPTPQKASTGKANSRAGKKSARSGKR